MPYIKKLVLKGFKSFAQETEIPFINGMNSIVGPNGSGKSNITDSICFVLGRLSIKSMRAARSSNLIFAGTKEHKPANEAFVKLIFDNSDKGFPIQDKEVTIERIVRKNGQGIYKINNEAKTRQEVLELLSATGIDPYGFNLILQGEISSIIRMQPEERRKIIEEVSGISIYETRKEKSLKELEKTDDRLNQVSAILRERRAYLRNLEEERKQALKFKQLQEVQKKCKASILHKKLEEKNKEISQIEENVKKNTLLKDKAKKELVAVQQQINNLEGEISNINSFMQTKSGVEQETLHNQITDLKAELAGLSVRKENSEAKLQEVSERKARAEQEIKNLEEEIKDLRKKSPMQAQKHKELEKKKSCLDELENQRKNLYNLKEKLNSVKERLSDKEKILQKIKNESSFILEDSESFANELQYKEIKACQDKIDSNKLEHKKTLQILESLELQMLQEEKNLSIYSSEISGIEKIKLQVREIDICPLCKSKITENHVQHVNKESEEKIKELKDKLKTSQQSLEKSKSHFTELKTRQDSLQEEILKLQVNLVKLTNLENRKEQIKKLSEDEKNYEKEIQELRKIKENLESQVVNVKDAEEKYDKTLLDIQDISARTEENLDLELELKERDLEATKLVIKQTIRDNQELNEEISELSEDIDEKSSVLDEKEEKEKSLVENFRRLIGKKDALQEKIKENNSAINEKQNVLNVHDNAINNLKIDLARLNAEKENFSIEFNELQGIELISGNLQSLQEKLSSTETALYSIGNVNLRALEVYDSVKKEYDEVESKSQILEAEKFEILKIIEEIDKKKKKTFMKTLTAVNDLFRRNFMQLSTKGEAFLDLENKEDPFSAGLNILIRVAKGKYFDITSLSGGEKTLVALSLLFAIQEYKPYCFYILDEVDAALDKRNSEKLAGLIKRYMKTGQYIVITHNDSLITESPTLYGVSMQEGISKVLSLEL